MSSDRSGGSRSRSRSRSPRRPKLQSKRVIIANIPYDVTWNKLKQLFRDRVGFTGFLRLMKTNGRPNGMGVMEFKTIEGAEKAIEMMNKFEISDRKIVVREETLRDQERMSQMEFDGPPMNNDRPPMGPNPMGRGPFGGANMGPPPMVNGNIAAMSTVTPMMLERMGISGPITDSLYISNLDYKVDWKKIKDIFKVIGRVIHASVKQDENGRSKGIAIVRFEHPYEALLALTMLNGEMINDRPIRVKIDREGAPAPPNIPIFPPTAAGTAAAANFVNYLSSRRNQYAGGRGPPAGFGGPNNMGPPAFMQGVLPQQSEAAAAAMASFLNSVTGGSGPEGFSEMPMNNGPYGGGQFRAGMPANAPSKSVELLNRLLNQQCDFGASGVGPMYSNQRGDSGFGMPNFQGGSNPLAQLIKGIKAGMRNMNAGFEMNSPERRTGSHDDVNPSASGLQQLFMAAAAGGMSQEQIANAVSALGIDLESIPGIGDVITGDDSFGERGMSGNKQAMNGDGNLRGMNSRRMSRSDFNTQPMMTNQGSPFGGGIGQRQFPRQQQQQRGGGPGGVRSLSRNMQGQQRPDSGRMFQKRGNFGGN